LSPTAVPDLAPALNSQRGMSPITQRKKSPLNAVLLIVVGLLVLGGVFRMMTAPKPIVDRVKVVAAGKDLPAGIRIGFSHLHMVDMPKKYVTASMATSTNELVGRITRTYIGQGEPISENQLLPGMNGLAALINYNERAITLNLDEDGLVDHAIYPGDRVDVVVTSTGVKDARKYTKTICQNLLVLLSVPKEMMLSDKLGSQEAGKKITLSATPDDAEKLSQASESGKIRLILRNSQNRVRNSGLPGADDRDILPSSALKQDIPAPPQLVDAPAPPPPATITAVAPPIAEAAPVQAPVQWLVDVFKGTAKEVQAVDRK
jgi:pilus assembly protein CpaB